MMLCRRLVNEVIEKFVEKKNVSLSVVARDFVEEGRNSQLPIAWSTS